MNIAAPQHGMDLTLAQQGIRTLNTQQAIGPASTQQNIGATTAQQATSLPATQSASAARDKRGDGIKDSLLAEMVRRKKREKGIEYWDLALKMGGTDKEYVVDLLECRVQATTKDLDVLEKEFDLPRVILEYAFFQRF